VYGLFTQSMALYSKSTTAIRKKKRDVVGDFRTQYTKQINGFVANTEQVLLFLLCLTL